MDKAKAAVSGFLSKDGKHDTTVHETVNPAIQQEHVTRTHHENVQKVVDREVHQDHFHTTVQPIAHKEVLPEQHTHQMGATEHKEIKHGNDEHVRQRLEAEKAQFKNTREVGETQHSTSKASTVTGEHIHHHVHESIQPVIQKETIQPSVVHTTIPVHEVHHNESKHHSATQLPAMTMEEFNRQGGQLNGREVRTDAFKGEPKAVGSTIGGHGAHGTTSLTEDDKHRGTHATNATGLKGAGSHVTPSTHHGAHGKALDGANTHGAHGASSGATPSTQYPIQEKVSLLDKINPMKDSNGDGIKGFMK